VAVASILDSVKKTLGISEDDTSFDVDVIMHINSALARLNQLGIGPEQGFAIEDSDATWDDFLNGDLRLNNVKTYTYLYVRRLFDPPTNSFATEAMKDQIDQLEWCINVRREEDAWVDPFLPIVI
jgi:hypothetical protein